MMMHVKIPLKKVRRGSQSFKDGIIWSGHITHNRRRLLRKS